MDTVNGAEERLEMKATDTWPQEPPGEERAGMFELSVRCSVAHKVISEGVNR